ncbi:MAG: hypothetical protein JW827_05875 [Spirochaetes bacterium]|nr:hypothetical protein [Spirochaetota bacterium]
MKKGLLFSATLLFILLQSHAQTATFYVDGSRPDDTGDGTSWAMAKRYIQSGVALLSGGDTLIIRDGLYTGPNNMLSTGQSGSVDLPSGNNIVGYTIIRGENYLGVIIDGQQIWPPLYIDNEAYIHFENLHLRYSGSNFAANFFAANCHHIKVIRCASEESWNQHFRFRYSHHCLFEECITWGSGSYSFIFGGSFGDYTTSQYNVARRCVSRRDGHTGRPGGNQYGSFVTYWADHTYYQNCISVDGINIEVGDPNYPMGSSAVFYTANGSSHYYAYGCITLNDEGMIALFESSASPVRLRNNAAWMASSSRGIYFRGGNDVVFENNLFGHLSEYGIREMPDGTLLQNARNNIIYGVSGQAFSSIQGSHSYNVLYNNTINYSETTPGTGEVTNINPLSNGLLYLPRIEQGSALEAIGEGGSCCGPMILKKIGVSGTLYGEEGWDTVTDDDLWPWENEDIIREKMRSYIQHGVDGTRGYCVDGQTLTRYIWEFLGNPLPAQFSISNNPSTVNSNQTSNLAFIPFAIKVYPNPVSRKKILTVQYSYDPCKAIRDIKLSIYTIQGHTVLEKSFRDQPIIHWDFKTAFNKLVAPGLYLFKISLEYSDGLEQSTDFNKVVILE